MIIRWRLNEQHGSFELTGGVNRILVSVEDGEVLRKVTAEFYFPSSEKMFFNGYQTWTYSPELTGRSRIRGLHFIPKFGAALLGLNHFGDYHFVDYPYKPGQLHGVSYCYFRDGSHYRLLASLDERAGYTLFEYDSEKSLMRLRRDCEGVRTAGDRFQAFELFFAEGDEKEVFQQWFDAMGIHNKVPKIKGYSSWYNHYQKINENVIRNDLEGAKRLFEPGDMIQIDDGWEQAVGDWDKVNQKKFPHGLAPIVKDIHDAGFRAGLWLAPFVCEKKSGIFQEHKDWLLQYEGKPWKGGPNWSGFYALDIDHPEVCKYLKRVFDQVFGEWKFDLVKLDFLYAAAPHASGDHGAVSDGPFTESRAERMIRSLDMLRELCGEKLILGCGVPLMPAFGRVDYCRVGCDMSLNWDDLPFLRFIHRERVSTRQSIENTIFRRELDGRAFGSDPDVFFLRDHNVALSAKEKEYLAAVNILFGSVWFTSDDLNAYTESKIRLYKDFSSLKDAVDIQIDPDSFDIHYQLDGVPYMISFPHKK